MSFADKFVRTAQRVLPSPFTIAILLTFFTILLALLFTESQTDQWHLLEILTYWEGGFFTFLKFAMQMMLILVLGHVLALTSPAKLLINSLVKHCTSTPKAAFIVTFVSILVAFFNWGLALILGAIFARKVGEYAAQQQIPINYPLIGAAGYSGLMVWHGGLSGSAPLKVAEEGHKFVDQIGLVPFSSTIFSTMNLVCMFLLLLLLPLAMYWMGNRVESKLIVLDEKGSTNAPPSSASLNGAERLDHSSILAVIVGGTMVFIGLYKVIFNPLIKGQGFDWSFSFINPNYIIFMLFGLAILLHGSFAKFNQAVGQGIGGSAGIMIQFPLYAGIMGIMLSSGLVNVFSTIFVNISTSTTFPLFTFFSAGLVNIFVPSGGGQWLVQGPILIEASQQLQVPIEKSIMALCYGDQITNMLQPFWALPLLGITGLKAKEILPYTVFLLVVGVLIFCSILLLF
ncbi:short-chain fatty acid transporter [Aureispira anguillae]|uniref:TIGR00366 family protein n=1 Tax=Aureispira anguillae TaxID=2864201 RepID=A0A916DRF7_9BACT|nr:TIGR00366 family protein [Aureispira anguillae]BDS10630.1 TIGR00366 family protein [Aureispira anguillae]